MSAASLDAICEIIQRDVGNRGLRTDVTNNLISSSAGDFHAACWSLARSPRASVCVVTGFLIPHGQPSSGETDGPLGALFLARALTPLGIRVAITSDSFCIPALDAGLRASELLNTVPLIPLPSPEEATGLSVFEYWKSLVDRTGPLTHLIAIERVGPSHTVESIREQKRDPAILQEFLRDVSAHDHDRCHTMRGIDITASMSPAHQLFEAARQHAPPITTIGIGDGGNEIGMGKIPWDVICRNIANGGIVACRVPTDHLIVSGISNWGAYGLAAGVRVLRGADPDPELFDVERERNILQLMIERGPLVDGMSGRPELSVDGFPFKCYAEPLQRLAAVE